MHIVWIDTAIALKGAKVIGKANFRAQFFEDGPIPFALGQANFFAQIVSEVLDDSIIVEESVINVEKKDHAPGWGEAPGRPSFGAHALVVAAALAALVLVVVLCRAWARGVHFQ